MHKLDLPALIDRFRDPVDTVIDLFAHSTGIVPDIKVLPDLIRLIDAEQGKQFADQFPFLLLRDRSVGGNAVHQEFDLGDFKCTASHKIRVVKTLGDNDVDTFLHEDLNVVLHCLAAGVRVFPRQKIHQIVRSRLVVLIRVIHKITVQMNKPLLVADRAHPVLPLSKIYLLQSYYTIKEIFRQQTFQQCISS